MEDADLIGFLVRANKVGYATGNDEAWKKEEDKSRTIVFTEGVWRMHDNFFGGEPYGGREVVFYKNIPLWIMVYYGFIEEDFINLKKRVYNFLRDALRHLPVDMPIRGPKQHINEGFSYLNNWNGNIKNFWGNETILMNGKKAYEARYTGGLVDVSGD